MAKLGNYRREAGVLIRFVLDYPWFSLIFAGYFLTGENFGGTGPQPMRSGSASSGRALLLFFCKDFDALMKTRNCINEIYRPIPVRFLESCCMYDTWEKIAFLQVF